MPNICLYFQIHQPWRLGNFSVFDIGREPNYFSSQNETLMKKVAQKSYRPMLSLLKKITEEQKDFHFSVSISGVAMEQMERFAPDIIFRLRELAKSGQVEFLSETYYHSLVSLYSNSEFQSQIKLHKRLIRKIFGITPKVFRNTELIYTNEIAKKIKEFGFKGMLAEGAGRILNGRKPTNIYHAPCGLPLLLKHSQLSDDIAFRFSQSARSNKPLTAETFTHWITASFTSDDVVNLFMDFETFGEHQWSDTGIFDFFYHFVKKLTYAK